MTENNSTPVFFIGSHIYNLLINCVGMGDGQPNRPHYQFTNHINFVALDFGLLIFQVKNILDRFI
jgi:hypothetical protein